MKVPVGSSSEEPRPQRGRRILCLDGGGIRGIMELVILKEIEDKTGKKIHELFDLIGGTSTGGIIALVLGLNLQGVDPAGGDEGKTLIDRTLNLYEKLATEVFGGGGWFHYLSKSYREYVALGGEMYSSDKLATLMQQNMKVSKDHVYDHPLREFEERLPEHSKCKTFAVSTCSYGSEFRPFLFRSYKNDCHVDLWGLARQPTFHGILGSQFGIAPKIWEAARGTSAAPTYFKPMLLSNVEHPAQQVAFVDGGMVANNPTQLAMFEAHSLWPDEFVDCVVSLGTGSDLEKQVEKLRDDNKGFFKAASVIGAVRGVFWGLDAVNIATDSENTHFAVRDWIAMSRRETAYFRFNPQNFDQNIDLAEHRLHVIKEMLQKAAEFVKQPIVQQEIEVLVAILLELPGYREKLRDYKLHGVPGIQSMQNKSLIG